MTTSRGKAIQASINGTDARIAKVVADQKKQERTIPLTTFEGIDQDTGQAKKITNLDCGGEAIATGRNISGGGLRKGSPVMARSTEAAIRLDGPPTLSLSTDCGSGGAPNPRQVPEPLEPEPDPDPETENTEEEYKNQEEPPGCGGIAGRIVPGSTRIVGLAKIYREYTGETAQSSNGLFYCPTREVIQTNSKEAQKPDGMPLEDTGCVSPEEEAGAMPPKRCQWFNATQSQALSFSGCPSGTFCSGFIEFPTGQYRIMCCTSDDSPAPENGIGAEWQPSNISETGSAAVNTNYCNSDRASMTWKDGGEVYSENPPISFSRSGSTVTFSDSNGAIKSIPLDEVLGAGISLSASPDTDYCDGKPKAILTWDNGGQIETINTPISYSLISPGIKVDWGGGDIDILTGESWTIDSVNIGDIYRWKIDYVGTLYPGGGNPFYGYSYAYGDITPTMAEGRFFVGIYYSVLYQTNTPGVGGNPLAGGGISPPIYQSINTFLGGDRFNYAVVYTQSLTQYQFTVLGITRDIFLEAGSPGYKVITNTGDISERISASPPTVTFLGGKYSLVISDATGEIANYKYPMEPTGFGVTCYDYAIAYQCRNKPICS